jgi:(1->4)-alpha-D-glucan 1-alpha-D-glucosylmutase
VARNDLMTRDLTLGAIRRALQALIVHYPVYRTYISACGRPARTKGSSSRPWTTPGRPGRSRLAAARPPGTMAGRPAVARLPPGAPAKLRHACVRFQQLTAPAPPRPWKTPPSIAARLLSRNDVGFEAERSAPPMHFHNEAQRRLRDFPDNLLTTATHDHKRGEDTRARLAVLSERGPWLASRVEHWRELAPLRAQLDDGWHPAPATS